MTPRTTGRPFSKTFKSNAQMFLHLPPFLGREVRNFFFKGTRTFQFDPIGDSGKANVTLTDFKLTRAATTVALGHPRGGMLRSVAVPAFTFTPAQVAVKTVKGLVNLKTGTFSIEYAVEFSSSVLDVFKSAGIDETVPLTLVESGRFNLGRGTSMQSRFAFKVRHDYRGLFQVGCYGKVCDTEAHIFASLDLGPTGLISPTNVIYICPGDTATLSWFTSDDVTEVTIDPSSGPDIGTVANEGSLDVTPAQTTSYGIKATGTCERGDIVTIVVVDRPTTFQMTANNGSGEWAWEFIAPASAFSKSLQVTRIQPKGTASGFAHDPLIVNFPYLNCNPPNGHLSNVRWFGQYEGFDGGPTVLFNVDETHATCDDTINDDAQELAPPVPLVGSWIFKPLEEVSEKPPTGTATFLVEIQCG